MKKIISFAAVCLIVLLPFSSHAFAPKKGDKDCIECHKLDPKDLEPILKALEKATSLPASAKVKEIKSSPVKGVWQIALDVDGKPAGFYLDFSKKYLIGQVIPVETLEKQPPAPPKKVDVSKIPLDRAILIGAKDASKKVIVFTDPDCPYCRKLHEVVKEVIGKHKDIAFELILNPLPMHKDAFKKAQTLLCTKSAAMVDDAYAGKAVPEPAADCTADAVEKNKALAASLNLTGTPALVRDDGAVLSGYLPEEQLLDWINKK